jgi:GH24 family phage-related lysozyme (muramidase)
MEKVPENPNKKLSLSAAGILALKKHEKGVYKYYNDAGKNKGNCTYGYGTLAHYGVCTQDELKIEVTEKMVNDALNSKIREFESFIKRKVNYELNQEQYDALLSYVYNRGPGQSLATIKLINDGKLVDAADNMQRHITGKVGSKSVVMKGLIKRRELESAPFRVEPKKKEDTVAKK